MPPGTSARRVATLRRRWEELRFSLESRPSPWLLAVLVIALVVRVAALLAIRNSVYFDFLLWDERAYHEWAAALAAGTWESSSVYAAAPLPAYGMAILYRLFAVDPLVVRVANLFLGVLTCLLVFRIGRSLGGELLGLSSALGAALYGPLILYSVVPLKTALSIFLFAALCVLLLIGLDKPRWGRLAALGAAAGLLLNVRGNAAVLVPAIAAVLALDLGRRRALRRLPAVLVPVLVGLLLCVAPFLVRNLRVAGEMVLTTSQTGFALYVGNRLDNPVPFFRPVPFAITTPGRQLVQMTVEASRREGRDLTPAEASSYWTGRTVQEIRAQPVRFLAKLGGKALAVVNRFEPADHYHAGFLGGVIPFFRLPFLAFGLLLPLAVAGILASDLRCSRVHAMLLPAAAYGATLIAFFTTARFRVILAVALLPFAARGIGRIVRAFADGRWRRAGALVVACAGVAMITLFPLAGTDDLTPYYNTHAAALLGAGRLDEAVSFWQQSSDLDRPLSAFANLSLAGVHVQRRDARRASMYLMRIPDDSVTLALREELQGDVLLLGGRDKEAIAAYRRSIGINAGRPGVRRKLTELLRDRGDPELLEELRGLEWALSFYGQP